jgi:diguanylate cyclase (GGDEF)-like protein
MLGTEKKGKFGDLSSTLKPEQVELKGFNRTLAEIEWLLLVLVLAYVVLPGATVNFFPVLMACTGFALFVLGFRYLNLLTIEARWKLNIETWVMIALTAFVIWHTGKADSLLVNLYLLPIVFAALTLGKVTALLQVLLITSLYLHAAQAQLGPAFFSFDTFADLVFHFAPFLLVAYLTSLLAADMRFGRAFVQHLSETDDMTGLPNMRAFSTALARERARAERDGSEFTILMIDIDSLKQINDEHGHDVGNQLIQHMVESIRRSLRTSDFVARYAGDEFIILLPNTPGAVAKEVAERIRASIDHMAFDADGERVTATVSIGYASYPRMAGELKQLLSRADQAMYASKKAGRNRVSAYDELVA